MRYQVQYIFLRLGFARILDIVEHFSFLFRRARILYMYRFTYVGRTRFPTRVSFFYMKESRENVDYSLSFDEIMMDTWIGRVAGLRNNSREFAL